MIVDFIHDLAARYRVAIDDICGSLCMDWNELRALTPERVELARMILAEIKKDFSRYDKTEKSLMLSEAVQNLNSYILTIFPDGADKNDVNSNLLL